MEMTQLNRGLSEAISARSKQERLARRLQSVEEELARKRSEVGQLQTNLAAEEQDVQRLKEGGLLGLWYDLTGKRERQLAKEEEEAALARLRLAEATERLQSLEGERSELAADLGALGDPGAQIESLLSEKERLIRQQFPKAADRLLAFEVEERSLESLQVELEEARAAGDRATSALVRMQDSLESARSLGVWDTWVGGGFLVDLAKHDRLDEAESWAEESRAALAAFQRELRDVDAALQAPTIGIDSWDRGFDIWFDNLWTDWSILNKIDDALEGVRHTAAQLDSLTGRLERQMAETEAELERTRAEREGFIASFGQA